MTIDSSIAPPATEVNAERIAERVRRGVAHYASRGHEAEWVGRNACWVPSRTRPGRRYLVTFAEDGESSAERCRCRDFEVNGPEFGVCLHTAFALVARCKRVTYRVEKRHDSRFGEVWLVIEERHGSEVCVHRAFSCGDAYHEKWEREGCGAARLEVA